MVEWMLIKLVALFSPFAGDEGLEDRRGQIVGRCPRRRRPSVCRAAGFQILVNGDWLYVRESDMLASKSADLVGFLVGWSGSLPRSRLVDT